MFIDLASQLKLIYACTYADIETALSPLIEKYPCILDAEGERRTSPLKSNPKTSNSYQTTQDRAGKSSPVHLCSKITSILKCEPGGCSFIERYRCRGHVAHREGCSCRHMRPSTVGSVPDVVLPPASRSPVAIWPRYNSCMLQNLDGEKVSDIGRIHQRQRLNEKSKPYRDQW